jgi:hypothetical protein
MGNDDLSVYFFILCLLLGLEWNKRRAEANRHRERQERIQRGMMEMMAGRPVNLDLLFAKDRVDPKGPLYGLTVFCLIFLVLLALYGIFFAINRNTPRFIP